MMNYSALVEMVDKMVKIVEKSVTWDTTNYSYTHAPASPCTAQPIDPSDI